VNTSYYIFTRGYATRENIASGVHSVKLYFNLTCKTNKYPLYSFESVDVLHDLLHNTERV
jgi:hypothetical protein